MKLALKILMGLALPGLLMLSACEKKGPVEEAADEVEDVADELDI